MVSFKNDPEWINRFGEWMILQLPDDMVDPPPDGPESFAYLIQFTDGNRIDLTLFPVNKIDQFNKDNLSLLLMDKDGVVGPFPPPDESDYISKSLNAKEFADSCNEFWWVCPYVAKGLWRDEITSAKYMLNRVIRDQLMKMINWYVCMNTNFLKSPGKYGKYYKKYLENELWEQHLKTYSDANYENTWSELFSMRNLFRRIAIQ